LQLLAITIITNALRRSEEIALAAEARAFSPEHSRALPVKTGNLDWPIVFVGLLSWLIFCFFS
jgi:energy-coupling factor transporter transmembrane protein EcfT